MTTDPPGPRSTDAPGTPQAPSLRMPGVRTAVAVTLGGGLAAAAVAGVVAGRPQVLGALVGAALVCGFFLLGTLNTTLAAAYAPRASLVVALLTYLVQVVGLWLVLLGITRAGLTEGTLDARWLAGAVIVGTLAWTGALVVRAMAGTEVQR